MILDVLLQLSSAQAVTTTAFSTNTIDLGPNRDVGHGKDLYIVVDVDATCTAAGAATVSFEIISSPNANLTTPSVLSKSDDIPIANLTIGRKPISIAINPAVLLSQPTGQRYLGVRYNVLTGPLTAGAFTCYITDSEVSTNVNYPSGFTVY